MTYFHLRSMDERMQFVVRLRIDGEIPERADGRQARVRARDAIRHRAEQISASMSPLEPQRLQTALEKALYEDGVADTTGARVWADDVIVELRDELGQALDNHRRLLQDEQLWQWAREAEEPRLAYWQKLLADPSQATAWWFSQQQDVNQLPHVAGTFISVAERLASAAQAAAVRENSDKSGSQGPEVWVEDADTIGKIVDDLRSGADPAERDLVDRKVLGFVVGLNREDLVERMRRLDSEGQQESRPMADPGHPGASPDPGLPG
ncbi:hypothetical protein [Actinopolymorpha pittospori]